MLTFDLIDLILDKNYANGWCMFGTVNRSNKRRINERRDGAMEDSFGNALKNARISQKATLREVGAHIKKSIGYISDIEHDRKRPPDLETVSKIEDFLGIENGCLVTLARKIRKKVKLNLSQTLKMKPKLSTVLLRAERLSDDKIDELLKTIDKLEGE